MSDVPLKDRRLLQASEYAEAIMGFINDETIDGETRKLTIAGLQEALHEVNPLEFTWQETTLFEHTDASTAPKFRPESPNIIRSDIFNLDYKSGNSGPRHSFSEEYTHFLLYVRRAIRNPTSISDKGEKTLLFLSPEILNSTEQNPAGKFSEELRYASNSTDYPRNNLFFLRRSNTTFSLGASFQSTMTNEAQALLKIVGMKLTLQPSSL